jgi:hypothetical protein
VQGGTDVESLLNDFGQAFGGDPAFIGVGVQQVDGIPAGCFQPHEAVEFGGERLQGFRLALFGEGVFDALADGGFIGGFLATVADVGGDGGAGGADEVAVHGSGASRSWSEISRRRASFARAA